MWKLIEHFEKCSEQERIDLILGQARVVKSRYKLRENASKAAFECNVARQGIRGGKHTSLDSRHVRACEMYDEAVACFKAMVERL